MIFLNKIFIWIIAFILALIWFTVEQLDKNSVYKIHLWFQCFG